MPVIHSPSMSPKERAAALIDRLADIAPESRAEPQRVRVVRAPGRVNLIGEHTDYNLGFVMPAAIGLETWMASWPINEPRVVVESVEEAETLAFDLSAPGPRQRAWIDYVAGTAISLVREGVQLRGVVAVVDTTIPIGSGLSSSAALELATAWTLAAAVPPLLPLMTLARAAQRGENQYVGVRSGLMDQFASTHGTAGAALMLDCRSLDHDVVPLPPGVSLVAVDTRSPHRLDATEYNARRAQCEGGVEAIARRYPHVRSLRDVSMTMLAACSGELEDETFRRCRHVVEESQRVLRARSALEAGNLDELGRLFAASHASLRDLYEVSSVELDALVEVASAVPGVVGARMTGAGFGGCIVALVHDEAVGRLRSAIESEYPRRIGREAGFYQIEAVDGAGLVTFD